LMEDAHREVTARSCAAVGLVRPPPVRRL
jgi:hypothetical protein